MTEEMMIELGRRAVACKGWRWMSGMRVMSDPKQVPRVIGSPVWSSDLRARVTTVVLGRWHGVGEFCVDHPDAEHESMSGDDLPGTLPDLRDPATLGCLLALVREAWNAPRALVRLSAGRTSFHVYDVDRDPMGGNWAAWLCGDRILQTEAEALVAALENAP